MTEDPSNQQNPVYPSKKDEDPVIEKVTTDQAIQRKRPLGSKIKNAFIRTELKTAVLYVYDDVLLPALRNLIVDTITKGVERTVMGEGSYPRGSRTQYGARSRYDYSSPYRRDTMSRGPRRGDDTPPRGARTPRRRMGDEVILHSRNDAEIVVERMGDICDRYGVAKVSDLNDLVGLPSEFTDHEWGWRSTAGIRIQSVREGYLIDLPPAEPII